MSRNYIVSGLAVAAVVGGVYFYKNRSCGDSCEMSQADSCCDTQASEGGKVPVDYVSGEEVFVLFTENVRNAIAYVAEGCDESAEVANNRLAERVDVMTALSSALQDLVTSKLAIIEVSTEKEVVYNDILTKFDESFRSCYVETAERRAFFDDYISVIKSTIVIN